MANQRATFSKRNREMKLKDRAKEKAERKAQRRDESATRGTKGPEIAWADAAALASEVAAHSSAAAAVDGTASTDDDD